MLGSASFQTQQQGTKWKANSQWRKIVEARKGRCWHFPGEWVSGNIWAWRSQEVSAVFWWSSQVFSEEAVRCPSCFTDETTKHHLRKWLLIRQRQDCWILWAHAEWPGAFGKLPLPPSILSSFFPCPLFSILIFEFVVGFSVQNMNILQSTHFPGPEQPLRKYLQEY